MALAAQTKELYAAIGRFSVEFEHVCFAMRRIATSILAEKGLHNRNVLDILLADQTAEPLRSLVESPLSETQSLSNIELHNRAAHPDACEAAFVLLTARSRADGRERWATFAPFAS